MAADSGFSGRLQEVLRDVYVPEIRSELDSLLSVVLAEARGKLDRGIRSVMDDIIASIKDLVEVRLSPETTSGITISINYPLPAAYVKETQ